MSSQSYTWKVTDPSLVKKMKSAKPEEMFKSPIFTLFNFRCYFELYPNGNDVDKNVGETLYFLYLAAFSPKIKSIQLHRKCTFIENGATHEFDAEITHKKKYLNAWPNNTLQTKDIQQYETLSFKVDVELYAVFDKDDNDITKEYENDDESKTESTKLDLIIKRVDELTSNMEKIQKRMDDMELRMNEEEKNNDDDRMNKLVKEIKIIKQNMNKLALNSNINPEQQKLKSWLEQKVKLPDYYDVFIENGIEDLSTAALLTMDAIKGMGIDKIGHQMKILNQVVKLKENKNDNEKPNEGGTAYIG